MLYWSAEVLRTPKKGWINRMLEETIFWKDNKANIKLKIKWI